MDALPKAPIMGKFYRDIVGNRNTGGPVAGVGSRIRGRARRLGPAPGDIRPGLAWAAAA